MNNGFFDIDGGYGRYDDMAFPHPILDRPQLAKPDDRESDFWKSDPHYLEICSELEAEEASRVWEESEAIAEERERHFERIQEAPLRHLKKR